MKQKRKRRITEFLVFFILIAAAILCIIGMNAEKNDTNIVAELTIPAMTEITETIQTTQRPTQANTQSEEKSVLIENFPHIYQMMKYPTGCESVAAVSLMQFYGVDITVENFIDFHLPTADYPYYKNDIMYGESPWNAFIGDPYSDSGYGCYSTVIVKAMKSAVPQNYEISAIYNVPMSTLCSEYIDNGQPVMIWATMDMREPYEGKSWLLSNGETFTFICPEHALVLIGYDDKSYYFCNPQSEEAVVSYPKEACETAYNALYSQAVIMKPAA